MLITVLAGPITFAGFTIPAVMASAAAYNLSLLPRKRTIPNLELGGNMARRFYAEAWIGQQVGDVAAKPCFRCKRKQGVFGGNPCVVVQGYFGGSCAGCHHSNITCYCSLRAAGEFRPGFLLFCRLTVDSVRRC